MTAREFNFDGIVGPTHNYSGLSYGNVASANHQHLVSSPKKAALQGLEKMKFVASLGIGQCVLPPLHRPQLAFLRDLGFTGDDSKVIDSAYRCDPALLAASYSASNMWTANAATVSPSADCRDRRLHFSPANLTSTLHRSLEPPSTTRIVRAIFHDENEFMVHPPLPGTAALGDEGAANHNRLTAEYSEPGIEVFVYGRVALNVRVAGPRKFPARQTLEACQALARRHGLQPTHTHFVQQSPRAIDAGAFHNDVVAVGNQNVFLVHASAFVEQSAVLTRIEQQFEQLYDRPFYLIEFTEHEIDLAETVKSYLFNSQLLTRPDGNMTLLCPLDCRDSKAAFECTRRIELEDNPIDQVEFLDLRQSMNNGGGPACLRLRVVMTQPQQQAMHPGVVLTDSLYDSLVKWVEKHYRDELGPDALRDPGLPEEIRFAMNDLCGILDLPPSVLLDA